MTYVEHLIYEGANEIMHEPGTTSQHPPFTAVARHGEGSGPSHLQRRWEVLLPHRDRLVRLCRSRLSSGDEAEDCAHEALLRALTFDRLDEARVGPFLTTVALRLCADRHRRHARHVRALPRLVEIPRGIEDAVVDRLLGLDALSAIEAFPPRERDVLRGRAQGLSTAEVANHCGLTLKATESAYTRARARLRRELALA